MTRHKHQPTADTMREQLALAADRIITLERNLAALTEWAFACDFRLPWRTRLWARIRGWFA